MNYSEIEEGLKVVIGKRGKEIWEILEPLQFAFDEEFEDEEFEQHREEARVYCENEHTGALSFLPIKMLEKAPVCPKCQEVLRFIEKKNGKFLGCRNYPSCKHYVPVKYEGAYTMSETLFEGEAWNH